MNAETATYSVLKTEDRLCSNRDFLEIWSHFNHFSSHDGFFIENQGIDAQCLRKSMHALMAHEYQPLNKR